MRSNTPVVWCLGRRFDPALHAPMLWIANAKLYPYHSFDMSTEAWSID
jgi:hypothetical protein